jgi:filamentous hemagglutinin
MTVIPPAITRRSLLHRLLYYYNARYYDPSLGRFIQADDRLPNLDNPQSYNRYSYALNNPLKFIDPSGHESFLMPPQYATSAEFRAGFNQGMAQGALLLLPDPVGHWRAASEGMDNAFNSELDVLTRIGGVGTVIGHTVMLPIEFVPGAALVTKPTTLTTRTATKVANELTKPASSALTKVEKATAAKAEAATAKGPVKPGDRANYGDLKAQKKANGETESLNMDHQPSFKAQVKAKENALGRTLTKDELSKLKANTPAVASPTQVHRQTSPTYGGRNTKARSDGDAADLGKAAERDKEVFDKAMQDR